MLRLVSADSPRRIGDETRARIAGLATGWDVLADSSATADDAVTRPTEKATIEALLVAPAGTDESAVIAGAGPDQTMVAPPDRPRMTSLAGLLESRRPGILGDVSYLLRSTWGRRAPRRELADICAQLAARHRDRKQSVIALGRAAAFTHELDSVAVGEGREELAKVEEQRAVRAGQLAAMDAEFENLARLRDTGREKARQAGSAIDHELSAVSARCVALARTVREVRRRGVRFLEQIAVVDRRISATEAGKAPGHGDDASRRAGLASLRAERASIQRDEPALAAELSEAIADLVAAEQQRREIGERLEEARADERAQVLRNQELEAAMAAKRTLLQRAHADSEQDRDRTLHALGEVLVAERPLLLRAQLTAVDAIELELGTLQRRRIELEDRLADVDRRAQLRGAVALTTVLAGGLSAAAWLLS
jgi:hypothetical protein